MFFDKLERDSFLKEYYVNIRAYREKNYEFNTSDNPSESLEAELDNLRNKVYSGTDIYIQKVPVVPLSRCPFSMKVVYHSIDIYGLDGPWWNYQNPLRPIDYLPGTFLMVRGAVNINGEIGEAPIEIRPGPAVPYVIPSILETPGVKAVVSTVRIGDHIGYPIFYFKESSDTFVVPLYNWGANHWSYMDTDGTNRILDGTETSEEFTYDYNLVKWIETEKLYWIKPDDPTFSLNKSVQGCPYLDIEGSRVSPIYLDGVLVKEEEKE